jgi:hypothetical protein
VQIDRWIDRHVGELLVPADSFREILGGIARRQTIEEALQAPRPSDRVVQIHRPSDDQRERALGLVHRLHAGAAVLKPRHEREERDQENRRQRGQNPDPLTLDGRGNAIRG